MRDDPFDPRNPMRGATAMATERISALAARDSDASDTSVAVVEDAREDQGEGRCDAPREAPSAETKRSCSALVSSAYHRPNWICPFTRPAWSHVCGPQSTSGTHVSTGHP